MLERVKSLFSKNVNSLKKQVSNFYGNEDKQKYLVLTIVCMSLFLDNMLYMVVIPIVPNYIQKFDNATVNSTSSEIVSGTSLKIGVLFASKAIVQLLVNPLSGTLLDRIGYNLPLMFGLVVIFISTTIFAFGESYGILFLARSLQGVGSAFADTASLAMIAENYQNQVERSRAMGLAIACISFGSLVAPPFGGFMYGLAGKELPFLTLSLIALVDALLLYPFVRTSLVSRRRRIESFQYTPIYRLFLDKNIAICAFCLVLANVSLAFLEPTISTWMDKIMSTSEYEIGLVWLPTFFPHVFGVYVAYKLNEQYPDKNWLIAMVGLIIEGVSCLIVPFSTVYASLMFPLMSLCFGIALVDTAILPLLGQIVDLKYSGLYGCVYAIADISYSIAYALGPVVAGLVMGSIGFMWLNVLIFLSNVIYAPVLYFLSPTHNYNTLENDKLEIARADFEQAEDF
ncbi:vesicular acetylcholine transporter unc-17-like [Octopus sinensis]|uniref:Vesicular acetylcholine transporter unc-17-like n=1 Tax=Octopus sinensis TaxID=2607531 RepID=A0A6P7U2E5_9MOLL|nr:vesicular acetylcholine transporter unc-17-like [Octopus sinensis]